MPRGDEGSGGEGSVAKRIGTHTPPLNETENCRSQERPVYCGVTFPQDEHL